MDGPAWWCATVHIMVSTGFEHASSIRYLSPKYG
jgi:hypothetical protein